MDRPDDDPFELERFVSAQRESYPVALAEIRAGAKLSHWSWYVFPQLLGLGSSAMARRYAIRSPREARAYLAHPVLGARLHETVAAMCAHRGRRSAETILGGIDAMKFRSCVTLFALVADDPAPFREALAAFFGGEPDPLTVRIVTPLLSPPGP